jgi:hypothetical protein
MALAAPVASVGTFRQQHAIERYANSGACESKREDQIRGVVESTAGSRIIELAIAIEEPLLSCSKADVLGPKSDPGGENLQGDF